MTACLALDLIEKLLLLDFKAVTEHLIACASQHKIVRRNCWSEVASGPPWTSAVQQRILPTCWWLLQLVVSFTAV